MPEKAPEKVEETTGRVIREAEDVARNAFRTSNDLMTTTIKYYFDTFGMVMRYSMDITDKSQHAMNDMLAVYRRMYSDSFNAWEGYINDVNKVFARPTK